MYFQVGLNVLPINISKLLDIARGDASNVVMMVLNMVVKAAIPIITDAHLPKLFVYT